MTTNTPTLLSSLIRCNQSILKQKLSLLTALESKYGPEKLAQTLFTLKCPIIKASIGQHYRHSMDHMELAVLVATTRNEMIDQNIKMNPCTIQYDQRVRGGKLETDVYEARKMIFSLNNILEELKIFNDKSISDENVYASFMLSSDPNDQEVQLKSTIGRELGFAAHHAIHHLAMVRVIAIQTLGLEEHELSCDFGKAPSTIRFENEEDM
jgi:hypothetical protein